MQCISAVLCVVLDTLELLMYWEVCAESRNHAD